MTPAAKNACPRCRGLVYGYFDATTGDHMIQCRMCGHLWNISGHELETKTEYERKGRTGKRY